MGCYLNFLTWLTGVYTVPGTIICSESSDYMEGMEMVYGSLYRARDLSHLDEQSLVQWNLYRARDFGLSIGYTYYLLLPPSLFKLSLFLQKLPYFIFNQNFGLYLALFYLLASLVVGWETHFAMRLYAYKLVA